MRPGLLPLLFGFVGVAALGLARPVRAAGEEPVAIDAYAELLSEARRFESIGNRSRAAAAYRRAFLERPSEPAPLVGLAATFRSESDEDKAIVCLAAALSRAPGDARIAAELESLGAPPSPGPATDVVALYLGFAPGTGPSPEGAVAAGGLVRLDALLYAGFDEDGRPVAIEPFFDVSPGLSLEDRPRFEIRARAPSAGEWIAVGDAASGAIGRAPIRIVGPPASLAIRDSRRRSRDSAEPLAAPPGDTVLLAASVSDAAGNRLWVPRLSWSASAVPAGARLDGALAEKSSLRPLAHFFEPHRNRLSVPAADASGTKIESVVVTATEPASGAAGSVTIRVDPASPRSLATPSALPFFGGTFEEAVAAARASGRPVFAVVAAHW